METKDIKDEILKAALSRHKFEDNVMNAAALLAYIDGALTWSKICEERASEWLRKRLVCELTDGSSPERDYYNIKTETLSNVSCTGLTDDDKKYFFGLIINDFKKAIESGDV